MILLIAVAVATIIACEIALRLPLARVLQTLTGSAKKVMHVIGSSQISDTWKEKTVPAYAGRIMIASLSLFGCLLAIAIPVVIIAALATGSLAEGSAALMRPLILLEMIVIGAGYIWLKAKVLA